jgi:hypothetical protein
VACVPKVGVGKLTVSWGKASLTAIAVCLGAFDRAADQSLPKELNNWRLDYGMNVGLAGIDMPHVTMARGPNDDGAEQNLAQNRLTAAGYGKWRPIDTNNTIEGRARNRRVELVRQ